MTALFAPAIASADQAESQRKAFKLMVEDTGAYAVSYEDLLAIDAGLEPLASSRLTIENRGLPVPIWLADGGDGQFGPGDHLELIADAPAGEQSFYDPHADTNVYWLLIDTQGHTGDPTATRMRRPVLDDNLAAAPPEGERYVVEDHIEQDRVRVRFNRRLQEQQPESWYWQRLSFVDSKPFAMPLTFAGLNRSADQPVAISIDLRGWSHQRKGDGAAADHRVEVLLDGEVIGSGEWQGQEAHRIEIAQVPEHLLGKGRHQLEVRVPERRLVGSTDPIIDVVLLNWIELSYPRGRRFASDQQRVWLRGANIDQTVRLIQPQDKPITVLSRSGLRYDAEDLGHHQATVDGAVRRTLRPARADDELFVVQGDGFRSPAAIEPDPPSALRSTARQADYIMITHPRLRSAIEPLAAFHRQRGLTVEVVDIVDVYDEFNHGIVHPQAIHDFLAFSHQSWTAPVPRFVLLVGDASWDTRNEQPSDDLYADWTFRPGETRRFIKNASDAYGSQGALKHRNLIPTWSYRSSQDHAASDNFFVDFDGDTNPEMAIGRLPVVSAEDTGAIVDKSIRYVRQAEVGPWRRRILWITNDTTSAQRRTEKLIGKASEHGFAEVRVFPAAEDKDNSQHQQALLDAFSQGQLVAHFYGHGGRYIWRTGPPDISKNHDLFTLEHLDQIEPSNRLPLVLSMSCYSAPFDHPTADSIGEKFLRLADRGAIAVFAASWRNSPRLVFSTTLIERLKQPGMPIGEAIRLTKEEHGSEVMSAMYNLLGDPALPLSMPAANIELVTGDDGAINATIATEVFEGRAIVDWLDADGQVLDSAEFDAPGGRLDIAASQIPQHIPDARKVRLYMWDSERQIDGIAAAELNSATALPTAVAADSASRNAAKEAEAAAKAAQAAKTTPVATTGEM